MNLADIPDAELQADLEASMEDLVVCLVALANGITEHDECNSIAARKAANEKICVRIKMEQIRRDAQRIAAAASN